MPKLKEISANDGVKERPDWEAFEAQYKKQFPKHFEARVASGEWEKVKEDYFRLNQ